MPANPCRTTSVGFEIARACYVSACSCGFESTDATRRAVVRALRAHFADA